MFSPKGEERQSQGVPDEERWAVQRLTTGSAIQEQKGVPQTIFSVAQ